MADKNPVAKVDVDATKKANDDLAKAEAAPAVRGDAKRIAMAPKDVKGGGGVVLTEQRVVKLQNGLKIKNS